MDPTAANLITLMLFWLFASATVLLGIVALVRKLIGRPITWFGLASWFGIIFWLFIGINMQLLVIVGLAEAFSKAA